MELIVIGKIVNTFGLKGEVKIVSYSDFDDERYQKGNTVYLFFKNEKIPLKVHSYRKHKGNCLVTFEEHLDINLVEKYKNCLVGFDKANIEPLEEGVYRFELLGLSVYDQQQNYLGTIIQIEDTVVHANLRIEKEDATTFLIPYIPQFVKEINLDNEKVTVALIPGLL